MTTEEAIEILSDVGDINRCCAEDAEALDMAIKALEEVSNFSENLHREREQAYMNGYEEGRKSLLDGLSGADYGSIARGGKYYMLSLY